MSGPILRELRVPAERSAWEACGFSPPFSFGQVRLDFGEWFSWGMEGVSGASIDGLATRIATERAGESAAHLNGVTGVDHVVVVTPKLERTIAAFEAEGAELRRVRENETGMGPFRQAFFRLGTIVEVVEARDIPEDAPARFWGITFVVEDMAPAADFLREKLGRVKAAVQPGRHIATFRKEAGLGVPVALMTPHRRNSAELLEGPF